MGRRKSQPVVKIRVASYQAGRLEAEETTEWPLHIPLFHVRAAIKSLMVRINNPEPTENNGESTNKY